jgi:predicted permease
MLPFEGGVMSRQLVVQGQETGATQLSLSDFFVRHEVWPDFFRTVGIPVLRGRDFAMGDRKGSPEVVIVNEAAARRYWPDGDALGALVRMDSDTAAWKTVIGIVGDAGVRRAGENTPMIYAPELQVGAIFSRSTLVIRTRGRARDLAGPARAVIRDLNPDLPVFDVRTLGEVIDRRRLPGQIGSTLLAIFGALALGLAVIGLHGVIAFTVVQRTREIGVRMALGATGQEILALFGRDALRMAAIGVGIGLVLALGAGRILSHLANGLEPTDVPTIATVAMLLIGVTLVASYFPARRAARVDPVVALRQE